VKKIIVPILCFIGGMLIAGIIVGAIITDNKESNDTSNCREFTIDGTYPISEIRINVNVADHPTIKAQNNLLTLGFINLNEPINENSEFLVRYTDVTTHEVVEFHGQDITRYVPEEDIPELLMKAEEYRLVHTGQNLVFDREGNIKVRNADNEIVHSGGYLWGGHTLSVVILDSEAEGPRYNSRNFLFFPDNEEFMQGTNCRRIILREKIRSRKQGSIELMFGLRCVDASQPLPHDPNYQEE